MQLRPYQRVAVNQVIQYWHQGSKGVLLAIPTGGGKTACGTEIVRRALVSGAKVLWVCHRHELVKQAASRMPGSVGCIHPDYPYERYHDVQVATVQTLLARKNWPDAKLLVLDECHHFMSDEWREVTNRYDNARTLGLTATPERSDGRPLGDIFDKMVAPVSYSDLIRDGYLVDCRVVQPAENIGGGLACSPVAAYNRFSPVARGFVFAKDVEHAHDLAEVFTASGIPAVCIEGNTAKMDRNEACAKLTSGEVKLIVNVYTMTEGVDVPEAEVCILARGVGHVSTYLQMVGRVLRPSAGKTEATLIDLSGASLAHGLPTEDRRYSLSGNAIEREKTQAVKVCLRCGLCYLSQPVCPGCGFHLQRDKVEVKIYNVALREVYRGSATAEPHKRTEFERLRELGRGAGWVSREYRTLFGSEPPSCWFDHDELKVEWNRIVQFTHKSGYGPKYALARFRKQYGMWPDRNWV